MNVNGRSRQCRLQGYVGKKMVNLRPEYFKIVQIWKVFSREFAAQRNGSWEKADT